MADQREERVILIRVDASAAIDGSRAATAALERMERGIGGAGESLGRMEASFGRVGGLLKANLALALAEIGTRMVQLAKDSLRAAGELEDMAEQMGISVKALQALQFSAVQGGLGLEGLQTGISKFSQKMGEAADGSKEMIEALDRIGVKILDTNGKLLPTEQLLGNVAVKITSIEDPAKRVAAAVDMFGKAGAKMLPMLSDVSGGLNKMEKDAADAGAMIDAQVTGSLKRLNDRSEATQLKVRALFAELGTPIVTTGLEQFNKVLDVVRGNVQGIAAAWRYVTGGPSADSLRSSIADAERGLADARSQGLSPDDARVQALQKRWDSLQGKLGDQMTAGYTPTLPTVTVTGDRAGVSNPGVKGAGDDVLERIAKLRRDTARELEEAGKAAEAAASGGAKAVADLEVHYKALKSAQDAYGKTADANKAGVAALTAEIEKQSAAEEKLKNLKSFSLDTQKIEQENEILAAENRLINESVEVRAREVALIKLRQDVENKGLDSTDEKQRQAIDRREAVITQNEKLKGQAEELKRTNELWLEPLKSMLQSVQQTAADMWESILEKGKFSAEEFAQLFAKMARRAIAELLAIATVRPVINAAIGGLGSLGLVSPATASALGYPQGGGAGGVGGGGGLFGSLGGGGLGGIMQRPVFGGIDAEIANWSTYGTSAQNSLAPTTWGQVAGVGGGLLSMGMGAMQLGSGKGIGSTIGGIGGLLGGGLGIAGALMPTALGGMLGPIGMGVGLLAGILPSLFGGGTPAPPALRGIGTLNFANGRFDSAGAGYGGGTAIDTSGIGTNITAMLKGAGINHARLLGSYGIQQQSFSQGDFSNATTLIRESGSGQFRQWGQSSDPAQQQIATDTAAAHIAHQMMMEADSGISDNLRKALSGAPFDAASDHAFSTQELNTAVSAIKAFDEAMKSLGKTTSEAEDALAKIDDGFQSLYETADKYGLDRGALDAKKAAERFKVGKDFAEGLSRQLMDPQTGALFDLDQERANLIKNNEALKAVEGYQDQILNIEELYGRKRAEIVAQFAQSATQSLQDVINRLTYGDLANASPTTAYSGTRATYMATLAQANAGNVDAQGRLAGTAEAYATAGRSYFASSGEYASLVDHIKRDLTYTQQSYVSNSGMSADDKAAMNALLSQVSELKSIAQQAQNESADLRNQVSELVAVLLRRAA